MPSMNSVVSWSTKVSELALSTPAGNNIMFSTQDWQEIGNNMYNTFKSWFWPNVNTKIYSLGQNVLRILHFLTHMTAIPQIWYHYGPSPHPNLVNLVKAGSEMIQPDFNIVFLGRWGSSCQVISTALSWN